MSIVSTNRVARAAGAAAGAPALVLTALLAVGYAARTAADEAARPAASAPTKKAAVATKATASSSAVASGKMGAPGKATASSKSDPAAVTRRAKSSRGQVPAVAATQAPPPKLSAEQIVARHVAARGGRKAWAALRALSMSGKMDAGAGDSVERSRRIAEPGGSLVKERREIAAAGARAQAEKQVQLPFRLARERPNKSRLEIDFAGKTAVQVYDGAHGWKLRPFLNRDDVEPFTAQEAQGEAESDDLDDPVMEAAARGDKVELERPEVVDGRWAYRLKVTGKDGSARRVSIDARTFLDVKIQGVPRRMDGKLHDVWVYQRDFRAVQGLKIPFVVETVVDGYPQSHRIVVEKVAVNPKLDAATFVKPKAG